MKITRIIKKNSFLHIMNGDKELLSIRNVKIDKNDMYLEFYFKESEDFVFLNAKDYAKMKGMNSFQQGRHSQKDCKFKFNDLTKEQKIINTKIGEKLKKYRIQKGLTRHDIQKAIGTTYDFVCKFEKGECEISRDNILILTKMYDKKPNTCLALLEEMEQLNGKS